MVTTAQTCALPIAHIEPYSGAEAAPRQIHSSLRCVMAWPKLRVVGLILASLLRTWPLEWISVCTTVSSWPILFPELQNGLDLGPKI